MNAARAVTRETATPRRRLVVHCRSGIVVVPLTDDDDLNSLLARVARRGGCVLVESVGDEEDAPCR